MIQALDKNSSYLMIAEWFKRDEIKQPNPNGKATPTAGGVSFRCKLVGDIRNDDEYAARNLMSDGQWVNIETLANYEFKNHDFIYFNNKWWTIDRITIAERDDREKTLGVVRLKFGNIKQTLYLVEEEI